MSELDEKDPTGADRLRTWIEGLRNAEPGVAPTSHILRMIHPGIQPLSGDGLVGVDPLSTLHVPGEDASAVSLLHYMTVDAESPKFDLHGQAAMLGALITLVTDRRCQVAPEIFAKVEGQDHPFAIPVTGQVDSTLGAPMPAWEQVDSRFREVVARLTSLPEDDMAAVSAAIHLHYCAALLLTRDLAGAYALTVGGIECLAQKFGHPPTNWQEWDKAAGWEKFITKQQLNPQQAQALRGQLMKDQHIKLAETFATYATTRLPDGFWTQPIRSYVWGVNADPSGAHPIEGSWSEAQPLGPEFDDDPGKAKAAFKTAYQLRSGFLHAGKRDVSFVRDVFDGALPRNETSGSPADKPRLSMAQLRAVLRSLIIRELVDRGDPDPKGLEETGVVTSEEPRSPQQG